MPDVIYGLRMMGVGASGFGLAAGAAFLAVAGGALLVASHVATTESRTRQLTVALKAMGSQAGVSGAELRRVSEQAAASGPFVRAETFAAAQALAYSRKLSGAMMGQVLNLGVDFSAATGRDLAAGVEVLVKALEKGYDGVKDLDDQFGFLTRDELVQIKTMAEHGRQADALRIAIDALNRRFKGLAAEGMSDSANMIGALGTAWNNLLDAIGGSDTVQSIVKHNAAEFNALAEAIKRASARPAAMTNPEDRIAAKEADLAEAEARLVRMRASVWGEWRSMCSRSSMCGPRMA